MWKSKKFIIIGAIISIVLVAGIAGAALAQTSTPTSPAKTLIGRVAAILNIDEAKVQGAFDQANRDIQNEALDARLKGLVDSGKMTQPQADQYKNWWQSRPDTVLPGGAPFKRFGGRGFCGGMGWRLPAAGTAPAPAQ